MQNFFYPPSGGGSSSNASVAPNSGPIATSSTLVAGNAPGSVQTPLSVTSAGVLNVAIATGIANPLPTTDAADGPASPGTASTKSIQTGGQFNTVLPTLTSGQQAATQLDSSGRLILSPSTTIPISAASLPLPAGASTSANQSTVIANQTNGTQKTQLTDGANPVTVTSNALDTYIINFPATFGSTQSSTPWVDNIAQFGGSAVTIGQNVRAQSLPVTMASDQPAIAISAASLPLPTGAATSANQTTELASLASILANQTNGTQTAQIATPPALTVHQAAIAVGTSAVRLTVSGSAPAATRVVLVANVDSAVTAKFYIGSSSVTNSGATRGIELVAGQAFTANSDAGDYWIVSDTATQTVFVLEQY